MRIVKRMVVGVALAAMLAVGVNTIFSPIDAHAATITTHVQSNASDPYDPIP